MRNVLKKIDPLELEANYIHLIAEEWMLVTAGDKEKWNTMTANWGGVGYLWNKPVVCIFIRPQRYTFEFVEKESAFTLSFFDRKYRPALNICGSTSGRDTDKVKALGLTPYVLETGNITFEEAGLILECKKLYTDFFRPEAFIDPAIKGRVYPDGDFHKLYIAEIVNMWEKK